MHLRIHVELDCPRTWKYSESKVCLENLEWDLLLVLLTCHRETGEVVPRRNIGLPTSATVSCLLLSS